MARTFVEGDAILPFDAAGEDDGDSASAAMLCEASDGACWDNITICSAESGCFGREAGVVVALTAAPAGTTVWATTLDRPVRRRSRRTGKRQRRALRAGSIREFFQ